MRRLVGETLMSLKSSRRMALMSLLSPGVVLTDVFYKDLLWKISCIVGLETHLVTSPRTPRSKRDWWIWLNKGCVLLGQVVKVCQNCQQLSDLSTIVKSEFEGAETPTRSEEPASGTR